MGRDLSAVILLSLGAVLHESIDVSIVNVDVVVTDRQGKHVHGLKPEDFVVYEGKERRAITNFSEYAASETNEVAAAAPQPRTFLIVLDLKNLAPLQREPLFKQLRGLLENVKPSDQVGLVTLAPRFRQYLQLSRRPKDIAAAFESLEKDLSRRTKDASDVDNSFRDEFFKEMQEFQASMGFKGTDEGADEEKHLLHRVKTKRRSYLLRTLFSQYAAIDGRKIAILVSDFFDGGKNRGDFHSTYELLDDIANSASESGFTLYSIHPSGIAPILVDANQKYGSGSSGGASEYEFMSQQRNSQATLVEPSGGSAFYGPGEVPKVVTQIESDLDNYYSLAFRRENRVKDRSVNIRVETKDRSLQVRSRRMIRMPSVESNVKDRVLANLFDPDANNDFAVAIEADASKAPSRKTWMVPIDITIDAKQFVLDQAGKAAFTVYVSASDEAGNVAAVVEKHQPVDDPAQLTDHVSYTLELQLRPAPHVISVGVLDEHGRQSGFARAFVSPKTR